MLQNQIFVFELLKVTGVNYTVKKQCIEKKMLFSCSSFNLSESSCLFWGLKAKADALILSTVIFN